MSTARPPLRLLPCLHCAAPFSVDDDVVRVICAPCILADKTFPRPGQLEIPAADPALLDPLFGMAAEISAPTETKEAA
jgi:hypothetical protein